MIHLFCKSSLIFPVLLALCLLMPKSLHGNEERQTVRVVFLGDSITAGYGLKKEQAYPAIIQKLATTDGIHLTSLNAGLSGDTTRGGLRRVKILARQPMDILVIALGGNDGLRGIPPQVSGKNLKAIIETIRSKQPKVKIILAGMQMPENMGVEYTTAFRKEYADIAKQQKVTPLPFLLEGVAAKKDLNFPDGIHPNKKGQERVAAHVYQALLPLIQQDS